jgi:hypothetical protein
MGSIQSATRPRASKCDYGVSGAKEMVESILVVDIPATLAASEAQQRLNDACERGYYLRTILPGADGAARAYFSLCCVQREKRIGKIAGHAIADIQQRIQRVLKSKGPLGRNSLYKLTNGRRDGMDNWDRALEGLVRGQLAETDGKLFWARSEE